jgi:glutamyl/glutaminyl-tRNA synthetase
MKIHNVLSPLLSLTTLPSSTSFAYAPNFITKIIQESSGITPTGLADVTVKNDDSTDDDGPTPISVGGITTRFPPEPNGYLHLGHAKAVSFNFAVARSFGGRCHMRLDDTNPTKEDEEYVESILQDVRWIQRGLGKFDGDTEEGPWYGCVRKTSDYFELIYDAAILLIERGEAFVDELTAEEMREYRGTLTEGGRESPWRDRAVEDNLRLFQEVSEVALCNSSTLSIIIT